jgi:hypothetical protein
MTDFLMFWLRCLGDAFTFGKGILSLAGFVGALLWIYYGRKHDNNLKERHKSVTTAVYWLFLISVPLYILFIAPYVQYRGAKTETSQLNKQISELNAQLETKSPKLDGFINQFILRNEVSNTNTNSLVFASSGIIVGRD